ncbi:MAG TPA: hypothetical protein VNY27_02225 [Solirubrobacteraceae bacterium]|jgi:hypothetical protein|nr:hypothetical protein [Solirubrobacteraceae bacterium]
MSPAAGTVAAARRRTRRALPPTSALLCAVTALALLTPAPGRADVFGPISLVSEGAVGAGAPQQAEYAHAPAISGDGRYVAFDGSVGGVTGVWRREQATGEIQQVAGGDAQLPSISQDGRYISFTTTAKLVPQDTNRAPDVYVADMDVHDPRPCMGPPEPEHQCAFTLASATNGSAKGLTYASAEEPYGSVAAGRSALSASGRLVAFVTTSVSNLVLYPALEKKEAEEGKTPVPHTPAMQVAVRNLDTQATQLVSANRITGAPVSSAESGETYGAVLAGNAGLPPAFTPSPAYAEYGEKSPPGASISADGTTVAWMGDNISEQAQLLPGEENRGPLYTEPLWRRIAPGSETPTERVTGGSDPANPACRASGEAALPPQPSSSDPCQGPFDVTAEGGAVVSGIWAGGGSGELVPRLSADGYTVAFTSKAPLVALGANFGRGTGGEPSDLYVANMRPGLTRDEALTQLTELAGGEAAGEASTAAIFDFDISADGSQVAFATRRTRFPLGAPAYVSAVAPEPGMNELFDVDLSDGTLTRVTHGYEGGASEHPHAVRPPGENPYKAHVGDGALSPSFSSDGRILAFSSTASNLVFGDGNIEGAAPFDSSDVFLTERKSFIPLPISQSISPPPEVLTSPAWRLGVSAVSRADGSVLLYVQAPGRGTLHADAQSAVLVRSAGRLRPARRASRARNRAGRTSETVVTRTVATATKLLGAGAEEPVTLVPMRLAKPYAALAYQRGGLSATVSVVFSVPGEPTLHQSVAATFLRIAHASRRSGRAAHRGGAHGGRR